MELDATKFAILVLFFGTLVGLFWDWISDVKGVREAWKDLLGDLFKCDEYWKDIDREDKEDHDNDRDKTINGDH